MKAREIYVCDGIMKGSKYLFTIFEDGNVQLKFFFENITVEQIEPEVVKAGNGLRIEYGTRNHSGTRSSIPFTDYSTGKLDEKWEKVL